MNGKALRLLAMLVLAMIALLGCSQQSQGVQAQQGSQQQVTQTENLVNGTISVKAGSYYDQSFTVTSSMTNAAVVGSFDARAALGDNIEVYILNDLAFENWSHGSAPPSGTYYNSGRITTDEISVSLPPGTYHLVFNNEYSLISTKQVTTTVNLTWTGSR